MNKILKLIIALSIGSQAYGQEAMAPAIAQTKPIVLTGGTIHVGNGTVIENGTVVFENGKIKSIERTATGTDMAKSTVVNCAGKHIYPGLIATSTNLGLVEVSSTKSTIDAQELGDINPSLKTIVAYNADSKIINTLRSNGILLAHIVPSGGSISGTSSVVQLDAWHYEDAAYKLNNGIHVNMPTLLQRPSFGRRGGGAPPVDMVKLGLQKIEEIKAFFTGAKSYFQSKKEETNLKYEAIKGLFDKTQKLYVHCDLVKEMYVAMDWKKEYDFDVVLVGATDSWMIADQIAAAKIAVILGEPHSMPATADDAIDQPYKTGSQLQKAGVVFTFCQDASDGFWQQRCIPFQAGTMAAYGLTKEEALTSITLNAAKILGVDQQTGSIEIGKDANIIVSEGDILDMRTSIVSHAYIQGRTIDLNNKQTELFKKFKTKYQIK